MLDKGYGIMPNAVLFDTKISSTSKLVFCLISSLTAQEGHCWANNEYIGKQLHLSKSQVSRSIKQLEEYIIINNPFNEKRDIRLRKNAYAVRQKCVTSLRKNAQHNTITNNINIKGIKNKYKTVSELGMPNLGGY
jgi:hypothetical protein